MPLEIGSLIANRMEIVDVIGKGQMTTVYKARDKSNRKDVAVKVLNLQFADALEVKRFQQQARLNARVIHPNIVEVYDFGITEDGEPYIVADLLYGNTLAEEVESEGPLDLKQAIDWFVQILEGLEVIHSQKVVMRDIKPSNILIDKDSDGAKKPVFIDFRVAMLTDNKETSLSQQGEIIGTPTFISPEACLGKEIIIQSDLYSLGCTFYYALLGKPPFLGDSAIQTMQNHAMLPPPTPSQGNPDLKVIDHIIAKSLAKNPDQRYQNATEMKTALKELL